MTGYGVIGQVGRQLSYLGSGVHTHEVIINQSHLEAHLCGRDRGNHHPVPA
ncbi:hypothetical protein ACLK1S_11680 [Escherichia coli]